MGYIICFESAEHPDCPPQPGFVRGTMHQVYTIAPLKNNIYNRNGPHMNECMLTAVVQVDPKGWISTRKRSCLSNQTYADAFGVSTLLQTSDIKQKRNQQRSNTKHRTSPKIGSSIRPHLVISIFHGSKIKTRLKKKKKKKKKKK